MQENTLKKNGRKSKLENRIEREIIFYIDDSGRLDLNYHSDYFVYAGYYFTSFKERDSAYAKFKAIHSRISKLHPEYGEELKAVKLSNVEKRRLYKAMRYFPSFAAITNIRGVSSTYFSTQNARLQFRDKMLVDVILKVLNKLISSSIRWDSHDVKINLLIYIDEQPTGMGGGNLKQMLEDRLRDNVFKHSDIEVRVMYRDSKFNLLIQASDILANRIWFMKHANQEYFMEEIPNHVELTKLSEHDRIIEQADNVLSRKF